MPELPEVESARRAIERGALNRRIADVDDNDVWFARPHHPGELRDALVGRRLTGAFRRGKSIWCETSGVGRSRTPGPNLGIHLGMSGRVLVSGADGETEGDTEGGDYWGSGSESALDALRRNAAWTRFRIDFADGGSLHLVDKRRLGRVRLDPPVDELGPDAAEVDLAEFRKRVGRGTAPIKARLLDQSVIAGVGNLLADETLWQAKISPLRPSNELDQKELAALRRAMRRAIAAAIEKGGVHTGRIIEFRRAGRHCPRCGAEMVRGTVGGRTTWWCPVEQH